MRLALHPAGFHMATPPPGAFAASTVYVPKPTARPESQSGFPLLSVLLLLAIPLWIAVIYRARRTP